jgi:hypothetical protein
MSIRNEPNVFVTRLLLIFALALAAPVVAGVHEDVGFKRLKTALGDSVPTGKGISVGQVESWMEVKSANAASGKIRTWLPNPQDRFLTSLPIVDRSGAPVGAHSGHATAVARRMIGSGPNQGMASDVERLAVFSISDWFGDGMLQRRSALAPLASPLRVINHSWAANSPNSQVLRRSDWLTDRDEQIQVAGIRNAAGKVNVSLLAASFNAVVVGRTDGKHSTGTPPVDDIYVRGRTRPHLVAPLNTTSAAAPVVSSAVIILLETAANPALSTRPEPFTNRGGQEVFDAGRSEVIRAVLMTAADRQTNNGRFGNITAYRDTAEHRTDNGLDSRFGAGQLNVYKAFHILNAGEQEQDVGICGFDYEPAMEGSVSGESPAAVRRYTIPEVVAPTRLTATLSWNLLFPYSGSRFDASAVLNDLDLSLYELSDDDGEKLVQFSRSRNDTTETIYTALVPGKRYQLVVSRFDDGAVTQDYALAWYMGQEVAR